MLTASVTGSARHWTGVLREGRKVVWSCGHVHTNRDQQSRTNGRPAHECAHMVLAAVVDRDKAVRQIAAMERSTPHLYAREHHIHTERMKHALATADSIRGGLVAGSQG